MTGFNLSTIEPLLYVLAAIAGFFFGLFVARFVMKRNNKKKLAAVKPLPTLSLDFEKSLGILNAVAVECIENRKFSLKINDKTSIPPVDEEIAFIVEKVLTSLGPQLLNNLQMFVDRKFIISYVARLAREYCQEYIEEVRFGKK